jgi:hypothetical protein
MVDMHVALQREGYEQRVQSPIDLGSKTPSLLQNQAWPQTEDPAQIKLEEVPKKKKKGLAKIWNTLTGSKGKGSSKAGSFNDQTRSFNRTEDDLPLAPPPPLSYLVERGPGEHNAPVPRQSTISLPSTTSPKNILSSPAMSPDTPPSSLLPSPSSSRPSNAVAGETRRPSWNQDEQEQTDPLAEEGSKLLANSRNLHQVTSEPDIRRPQQDSPSSHSSVTVPPPSSTTRPQSTLMREKSLPPLPDEINLHPPTDQLDSQPRTMYPHDHRQIPAGASPPVQDFFAPRAPFHAEEARRQSFGGITTRPNFTAQTLPSKGLYVQEFSPPANKYNEFGTSRRSLGYLDHIEEKQPILTTPSKRKSKFGLTAFLGRKSQTYDRNLLVSHDSSTSRRSTSDVRDDITSNGGYGTSASRHSVGPRMSVMSRKAVEELVEQDPTFVAYRYPSGDQRIDFL